MANRMARGRGMAQYGEAMAFDSFFSGSWNEKEI
jgi:hypothetical protein